MAGACACATCAGFALAQRGENPIDVIEARLTSAARDGDASFARTMAGGMRDYERSPEVQAFKLKLFEQVRPGDDVVEIGIGSGPNLCYYGKRTKRVVAVEPNMAFDPFVEAEAAASGTTLTVVQGYAEELPFPDASVDAVVGTMVLCSVRSVAGALREARRVLKPGGRYVFTEHTRAPRDWTLLNAAQVAANPLQIACAKGCHLRRDPLPEINAVFGSANVNARSFVMSSTNRGPPWPPHFLLAPHLVGYATKA